jgi:replication initiation protein RepC
MTLGMLLNQRRATEIEAGLTRNKWQLFRLVCEARAELDVTDRALTVLDALLTFFPDDILSEERGLIVFPSNAQLSIRAKGMTPATLRRHLAVLVEAGLIIRRDSPNGKRYARRGREGEIAEAYGFSLAPLLARAIEIETIAAQVATDRELLRATKERVTICRRDIAKLIAAAVEDAVPGNWEQIFATFRTLLLRIPRVPTIDTLTAALEDLEELRDRVVKLLENQIKTQNINANESHTARHIQNSKPESTYELEPAFETKQGERPSADNDRPGESQNLQTKTVTSALPEGADNPVGLKSFPLGLVLRACPQISDYGPCGTVTAWRDLMSAAVVVRSMLGVSPSAYEEACSVMGPENAATVIACILERGGHINSAGGYLRDLTRRAEKGEFALGPMLMALLRANGAPTRHIS